MDAHNLRANSVAAQVQDGRGLLSQGVAAHAMDETRLFDDVFCLPDHDHYLIYLPLREMVLLGNQRFVQCLYQARCGDPTALQELGLKREVIDELFASAEQLAYLKEPRPLPPFKPTSVSLFLTNACTLRCVYCYADGGRDTQTMAWDTVTGVLDEILEHVLAADVADMVVNFHGGGDISAAWPLFERARKYLRDITMGAGVQVHTAVGLNGMLTPRQRKWLIRQLDSATISLDGPPDIQNAYRPTAAGGPSFDQVSQTLHAFDAADFHYGIRSTVAQESVERLEEIVTYFCEHFRVKMIQLEPMHARGRGATAALRPPDATVFVEHFRRARKIAQQAGRELVYSGARLRLLCNTFCQAANGSCAVTPEGYITSCYEVLRATDPFADTFFYGHYDPLARRMVVDEERRQRLGTFTVLNKPSCASCFCKWHCAGDCLVKSLHAERTIASGMSDRCYITRELTKDQLMDMAQAEEA